jgi:hypothetical protein
VDLAGRIEITGASANASSIDNLHRNGIAFILSPVHEMGHRSFSDKKATLFSHAVDNAVPRLDPPA